jgi:hypothetical protein
MFTCLPTFLLKKVSERLFIPHHRSFPFMARDLLVPGIRRVGTIVALFASGRVVAAATQDVVDPGHSRLLYVG